MNFAFCLLPSAFGISHSSSHTFSPSCRKRSASGRTTALSLSRWLRKTSYWKSSDMKYAPCIKKDYSVAAGLPSQTP